MRYVLFGVSSVLLLATSSFADVWHAGDRDVDGKVYLISQLDLQAIVGVARHRLAQLLPWSSVMRVHVEDVNKVEVALRAGSWPEDYPPTFTLQRLGGQWRITQEDMTEPVILEH